jgi:alanine dehydrogenase
MKLVVPKEIATGENRVGVTPDSIPSLKKMGFEVFVESNAGLASSFTNEDYKKAGAKI